MSQSRKPINILFRNDDPCALSDAAHERRYLEIFAKHGIPQVVSVIPFMSEDPHNSKGARFHELSENPAIVRLLKEYEAKGLIEIAQHGTTHQTNELHPSSPVASIGNPYRGLGYPWLRFAPMYPEKGYSEFNGLDKKFVRSELKRGKDCLEKVFGKEVGTFTFPWGSLDLNALQALKEENFKTALCGGRHIYFVPGLTLIYNAREDVFGFAREIFYGAVKGPALYHVVLHSWMLTEEDFAKLDRLLSELTANHRIGFVTVKDLRAWPASFKTVCAINHAVRSWAKAANLYLGAPVWLSERYDLQLKSYWKDLLKCGLVKLVFEKIGFNRTWALSGLFFLLCLFSDFAVWGVPSLVYLLLHTGFGMVFAVLSLLKFKNYIATTRYGLDRQGLNDYAKVSVKAFRDPQNRPLAKHFFRLFKKEKNPSTEDWEKYLQLQYFHSSKPWEALNELAKGYIGRGLLSLARMCLAESLLQNPNQKEVFEEMERLKDLAEVKRPKLADDTCAISVVVCTNREPVELKTCLKSILAQTFQDFEIIVVNNNGPQEIRQVAESFFDKRIVYKEFNESSGLSKARNAAIEWAKGKFIAYLDDDDVYYPDHLETLHHLAQTGPYRFVYAKTQGILGYLGQDEFCAQKTVFTWGGEFDRERFASRASLGILSVLHDKNLFRDLGSFDEELIVSEDEDFYLRCAEAIDLKHVDKNTSEYRIKNNNSVIINAARNHFNGTIVRRFHAAFKGELACLKYAVNQGDLQKGREYLQNIRRQYLQGWFKSAFVLNELWPLAKSCGDEDFVKVVVKDFCRLYKKECLRSLIVHRDFFRAPMIAAGCLKVTLSFKSKPVGTLSVR